MSLLTLSDLIAAYKTVSPDKEWALGGLEDANKFANAIEAAVIRKLAGVSVEPCAYLKPFGELEVCIADDDLAFPVYPAEALAAARVQGQRDAEAEAAEEQALDYFNRYVAGDR